MKKRSAKKVRSGPWNGVFFGGTPKVHNSVFEPILVRNEDEIYYTYRLVNDSVSSRLTLNQSGAVERLVMYGQKSEWTTIYSVPVDTCENYGQCGANAICRARKSPICECLQGYRSIPEEELDIQNFYGSRKCETRLTLDCRPESARSSKRKKMLKTALVASMSTLLGIFVSGLILCVCWRKIKKKVGMDRRKEDMDAPLFDLDTIANATNNFAPNSIIGAGGFGSVYKFDPMGTDPAADLVL
ncbi:hypothetical protein OIU84_003062 [Salix udensis]|uniref:S-locus glycoprotein domain-containing protein n=1 Tax=Salix udensis TaxID=889485 RepID=A0AAD6K7G1_9ROSI|nr:hypothetical protein OIU84_003062 [Salix udensis]